MEQENFDFFDQINEERHRYYEKGVQIAYKENPNLIQENSYNNGYSQGKEISLEIGYYLGIVESLKPLIPILVKTPSKIEKLQKTLIDVEKFLINFDIDLKNEEDISKELTYIRTKMKILCSNCDIKLKSEDSTY